jgi:hypothetical protein
MEITGTEKPDWVKNNNPETEMFLDLRRYLRHGLEPLPAIGNILKELRPCQVLRLATSQDPNFLDSVLAPMGFEHFAERKGKVWNVFFRKCEDDDKGARP